MPSSSMLNIDITQSRLGLLVMQNKNQIHPQSTMMIRDRGVAILKHIKKCYALKPIIETKFDIYPRLRDDEEYAVVFKFIITKDKEKVWEWYRPKVLASEVICCPKQGFDLLPYRWFGAMKGEWKLSCGIVIIPGYQLPSNSDDIVTYFSNFRYQPLADLSWDVVRKYSNELRDDGRRVMTSLAEIQAMQRVASNADDI